MSFPSTTPTLGTLPTELLQSILPHLHQHDLTQCVRVCRSWEFALTPYLWHTIAPRSHVQLHRFFSHDTRQALNKNAVFVRELHLYDEELYSLLLPSCATPSPETLTTTTTNRPTCCLFANLHTLELHALDHPHNFDQGIMSLVRQNPDIRRFVVRVDMNPEVLVRIVTDYLPNLQDFCLDEPTQRNEHGFLVPSAWNGDVKMLLENLPESVRKVSLRNVYYMPFGDEEASKLKLWWIDYTVVGVRRHHSLESLHIDGDLVGRESEVLVPFLESCSHKLQSATGLGMTFLTHPTIAGALSKIGFTSKVLNGETLEQGMADTDLAKVISRSAQWTRIWLRTSMVGQFTADAIVDYGTNLVSLEIMHHGGWISGMTGSHLQAILSKAPKLKMLLAHWLVYCNEITATDILSSEWATTSLEHIDFKICVPRAGVDDDDEGNMPDGAAVQSSRATQRQVLRRLGQQTNFRRLVIGGMLTSRVTNRFGIQCSCLEMTLESGLDELAGLKELEELDIHHMDHRVGVSELEWMAENFPKLRRLRGMYDSLHYPSPEVVEWLQSHRPDWGH